MSVNFHFPKYYRDDLIGPFLYGGPKIDPLEERCPGEFLPFVAAFRSFNAVVEACYGYKLAEDYLLKLQRFKTDYMKLGISVTQKVHAIFNHIEDFSE